MKNKSTKINRALVAGPLLAGFMVTVGVAAVEDIAFQIIIHILLRPLRMRKEKGEQEGNLELEVLKFELPLC